MPLPAARNRTGEPSTGSPSVKAEKKDNELFYTLDRRHDLKPGDEVIMEIEWPRRYRLMRLHFAAEIIRELVNQRFNKPGKVGHTSPTTRHDSTSCGRRAYRVYSPLLEEKAHELIEADLPIESAFSDHAAEQRYWKIDGFARVPCGGTHLRKTGEIGTVSLKRHNIGKGRERIEIYVP